MTSKEFTQLLQDQRARHYEAIDKINALLETTDAIEVISGKLAGAATAPKTFDSYVEGRTVQPRTKPVLRPVEQRLARSDRSIGPEGLPEGARRTWEAIARTISETGLSPAFALIVGRAKVPKAIVSHYVKTLENRAYIRKEGNRKTLTLHVLKWPEGVTPRETVGRSDGAGNPDVAVVDPIGPNWSRPPSPKVETKAEVKARLAPKPQPRPQRHGPATGTVRDIKPQRAERDDPDRCATAGCRWTRQPGKAHCSTCSAAALFVRGNPRKQEV